ncbi:MAG: twin-arginine translocase TatA/TatE family subunit [Magnetococcales bacterium]|nr:twin-arginine translocase TatA/TatE family subunit [Magnetococcales bacterium]
MFGLGTFEMIIILVIVLVVFGAGKLPKVMGDLGRGVKSFKTAMSEEERLEQEKNSPATAGGQAVIEGETKKDAKV